MQSFVAVLRGINVGGKHTVPMADLRALCEGLGYRRVRTYIQSGNVIFEAGGPAETLASTLAEALQRQFGFGVPVVVRPGASLRDTLAANPFGEASEQVFVAFLSSPPAPERFARLDLDRSPPDRFVLAGSDLFLLLPNGAARTKLTVDWIERHLGGVATVRNLRTVAALAELGGA